MRSAPQLYEVKIELEIQVVGKGRGIIVKECKAMDLLLPPFPAGGSV